MKEYEDIFDWYLEARDRHTGVESVREAFCELQQGSTVVDLGCGTGLPLSSCLNDMGLRTIGVDSSSKMIAAFKDNLPDANARLCDIQEFEFHNENIDGVLSWGCIFHLVPEKQITVLNKIFKAVNRGGRFLFTSAKAHGDKTGEMNGVRFQYYSLGSKRYNELAKNAGWQQVWEREDEGKNYEYLFQKL